MVRRQEALTIMKPWIKEYNYRLGSPKLLVQYQPNINLAPGFDVQAAKIAFWKYYLQTVDKNGAVD